MSKLSRHFVIIAAVSGTGALLALIYRSANLNRRIQKLLGYGCDDSVGSEMVSPKSFLWFVGNRKYAVSASDISLIFLQVFSIEQKQVDRQISNTNCEISYAAGKRTQLDALVCDS